MSLSHELAVQFAKITKDKETTKSDTIVYGTAVVQEGSTYVKLDGSDTLTPVSTTAVVNDGERVSVLIKNHTASITGNSSSPAARAEDVATSDEAIKNLQADNITLKDSLSAANSNIKNLQSADVTITKDVEVVKKDVEVLQNEISTVLRIESSRGIIFKNNQVSTVLSAVIYKGSKRITDISTLKSEYGDTAYLEWSWQRLNEDTFTAISSTDSRISNNGFSLTLSSEDVDTKVTFMCQLITE